MVDVVPIVFCRWQVCTWEHAVARPASYGKADCVRESESNRVLPADRTAAIFAKLQEAERFLLRWTDPLSPYDVRVLRDTGECAITVLKRCLNEPLKGNIGDIVEDWHDLMYALCAERGRQTLLQVTSNAGFGPLLPSARSCVIWWYRVELSVFDHAPIDADILLGPGASSRCLPGPLREIHAAVVP
jgi:hypothetical protein